MPSREKPEESNSDALIERRRQPRGAMESTDWETIVLRRIERHVESLSDSPSSQLEPHNQPGWEEVGLMALRRRILDLKSE